jgi:hypothetical protein
MDDEDYDPEEAPEDNDDNAPEDELLNSGEIIDEMDFQDEDQIEQELDL